MLFRSVNSRPRRRRPSSVRIAVTPWWCCRSSCAAARFGRRQHRDDAPLPPLNSTSNRACGGLLRVRFERRPRKPRCQPPPKRSCAPQATCACRRGLDEAPRAARSRRQRRPIAIAVALNHQPWRSPRFPPSRLMQHLPADSECTPPPAREGRCHTSLNWTRRSVDTVEGRLMAGSVNSQTKPEWPLPRSGCPTATGERFPAAGEFAPADRSSRSPQRT